MLSAPNLTRDMPRNPHVKTRATKNDSRVVEGLIALKNTPSRATARPVRDIESARPPQMSTGSQASIERVIGKVLLAVGGLGLATYGLANSMNRRPDASDLQRPTVSNSLILPPDHQVMNGSSQFVNETAPLDELSHAPRNSMIAFLTDIVIDDIGAIEVARDEEIKEHFPEIFNAMEKALEQLVAALEEYKNNCAQSCDSPMALSVNATQLVGGLIDFLLEADGLDASLANVVFDTLLSEMGVSREVYAQIKTYIHRYTNVADFISALAKNPCYERKTVQKCLEFILIAQTPDGMQRDQDDNRPTTYAATASPIMSLISDKVPVILTTHIKNLTDYSTALTHIFSHEMVHYAGYKDTVYANVIEGILTNSLKYQDQLYLKIYADLRNNIAQLIDVAPISMQPALLDFYDLHVSGDANMTEIDKLNDLKVRLTSDNRLWSLFREKTTDFIAMDMLIPFLRQKDIEPQKKTESWSGFFSNFLEMFR